MTPLRIILRVLKVLLEPIQFAAGFVLGIALGLITLGFEAIFGVVYLALLPVFFVGPLVLFLYVIYWLAHQK